MTKQAAVERRESRGAGGEFPLSGRETDPEGIYFFTPMKTGSVKATLIDSVRAAGQVLLKYLGKVRSIRQKESPSSVVCEADLAVESLVSRLIRKSFPGAAILGEETGLSGSPGEYTWVIDPLDGTSNFVAGLPWFGVQVGILRGFSPLCAAMYLPVDDVLFYGEVGKGVWRNGKRVSVTRETNLKKVLCAFGFDGSTDVNKTRRTVELLAHVASGVRNTRATNCLLDFCYSIDGRLGGCLNQNCKIWDILPAAVMMPEAGGKFTDLQGKPHDYRLGYENPQHGYTVLTASRVLHPKLLALVRKSGVSLG